GHRLKNEGTARTPPPQSTCKRTGISERRRDSPRCAALICTTGFRFAPASDFHPFLNSTRTTDMTWEHSDKTAIVGVGATDYFVRGKSWPRTIYDLAGEAILKACADAGINVKQIDGFAYYSGASAGYVDKMDTADFMEMLGIP